MKNNEPDRLNIEQSDREKYYNRLLKRDSPFAGRENKNLFIMAMVTGFREGARVKLRKKEGFVRTEYLSPNEKSIIKAIAVATEGSLDVLLDKRKVYSIAEEYAASGIKLLKDKVFSHEYGSYIKKLESELVDEFEKINKMKYNNL